MLQISSSRFADPAGLFSPLQEILEKVKRLGQRVRAEPEVQK